MPIPFATLLMTAAAAASPTQAPSPPSSVLEGADVSRARLVATRVAPAAPAACFVLYPSGALVVARPGDKVVSENNRIERIGSEAVDIAMLTGVNGSEWFEIPFRWPVAADATAEQKQRCFAAFDDGSASAPPVPVAPLPLVLDPATGAPPGWRVIAPPTHEADLQCANYSRDDWEVATINDGSLRIQPARHASAFHLALPGGEIVGVDHGEFGGSLDWIGSDGRQQALLPDARPKVALQQGDWVYVAEGLAHLGYDQGRVVRLHRGESGAWKLEPWVDLGSAPGAAHRVDATTWRVVTTQGVVDVDLARPAQRVVHRGADWWRLYAGSLGRVGDVWYIGARFAVIRLTPTPDGYREEWLTSGACVLPAWAR